MYFWNIDQLRADLAKRSLSESAQFRYLLVFLALTCIGGFLPRDQVSNNWDKALSLLELAAALAGTSYLYKVNGGARGNDFLARYFSLSLVFAMRFLPVAIPLLVVAAIVGVSIGVAGEESGPYDLAAITVFTLAYLLGVARHMKLVVDMERDAQQFAAGPTGPDGPAA